METPDETIQPEINQPVPLNLPGDDDSALNSTSLDQVPDWLLELVNTPSLTETPPSDEDTQAITLPTIVFSAQERSINAPIEPEKIHPIPELQLTSLPRSIWEEEDAVELGQANPNQVFSNPLDELKILLDEDPQQTAAFIRANMSDPHFREQAIINLRAYLTLDPRNDALWMVYDELQSANPQQEA